MIGEELANGYATALDATCDLLERAVMQISALLDGDTTEEALRTAYAALVAEYGSYTAQIAVEFYTSARAAANVTAQYSATAAATTQQWLLTMDVNDAMKAASVLETLKGRAVQRVMERADDTLLTNAAQDPAHPLWAIVPQAGACAFCRLVASNGYQYASESRAERAAYRHPHCRCKVVLDFDPANPGCPGYDWKKYRDEYYSVPAEVFTEARAEFAELSEKEQAKWKSPGRSAEDHYTRNKVLAYMGKHPAD